MDITRWSTPKSDWLYSFQPKMEKIYTVSKNKTRSWLWRRSWTPYTKIKTQIEESRETTRPFRYDLNQIPYDYTVEVMAPHSSTLAWKIPWMEEPGILQPMGSLRVGHDWPTSLSLFTFMHWRRKWQPTPVFLPGESQGQGSLVGRRMGRRVGHNWSDLAAAAAAVAVKMLIIGETLLWWGGVKV